MDSSLDVSRSFRFDLSNILPQGHEKALKQAIYNVAAFVFALFVFTACVAVYYVLEPFLGPLLWAVLFGSVLHPFKHSLTVLLKRWLNNLRSTSTPFTVGAMVAPFQIIDSISDRLLQFIMQYAVNFIVIICITFIAVFICSFIPDFMISSLYAHLLTILQMISSLLEFCNGATIFVWSIVIGYLVILTFWWTPNTRQYLICVSPFVWSVLICHLVSIAGSLRLTILLILFVLMVVGFVAEIKARHSTEAAVLVPGTDTHDSITPMEAFKSWFITKSDETDGDISPSVLNDTTSDSLETQNVEVEPKTPEKKQKSNNDDKMSNYFLYGLVWACVLAQVWLHIWLLNLLLIPSIYIGIKQAAFRFGFVDFLKTKSQTVWERWKDTIEIRKDALIPAPVRGLWRLLVVGDQKVLTLLEGSIDSFTSIVAIFIILVFAIVGTIFISVQIYGESMHLVGITSNLINKTVHDTEIQLLIPEGLRDVHGALDAMLGDAYEYARGRLNTTIRHMIDDKDEARAAALVQQVLDVFDRVYDLWKQRDKDVSDINIQSVASVDNLMEGLKTLNFESIISFVKENLGTFMSVLESIWIILKGNISLAFSAVTAILSIVFGGGTAVLNFLLNFIIFTTSLFYLLCASGEQYKPVELFNSFVPSTGTDTRFGRAVEEAINSVFAASFKMAAFYGLYTWLIHTLFYVKIVYIPSVLAAVFGAVPFLGAYWACLPAVLELWLVYGQIGKAGFMLACQIIPMSFVDSAIYSEITGNGHPYLTGLAIAGGVFCLGFEGALFGPMLLCVLFVVMKMYGNVIQPSYTCSSGGRRRSSRPSFLQRMLTVE